MRALFLDRDGVVNVDFGHVGTRDRFEFMPGIFDLARAARTAGFEIFIVTNQAGIARGLYTEQDFQALMDWVGEAFDRAGAPLRGVYHCPHHPTEGLGDLRVACSCRKPMPGLLLAAAQTFCIDMPASIMIGDRESDMQAGCRAGVGTLFLLGQGPQDPRWRQVESLRDVIDYLVA
ncbi:D-glycero-alpha-D-manno-heptose-1,7-bisphosphate 7-phosphatase [Methylobacterium sp. A54F]